MRIFKTRNFSKWASREGLTDKSLKKAVVEVEHGLVDAQLGGHLLKKRVARSGRGKRGGVRTILAVESRSSAFFIYGFAKNARSNITRDELKALKLLAAEMIGYEQKLLEAAVSAGALIEVK